MNTTKVWMCDCKNTGQDTLYGKGMRLFNKADQRGKLPRRWRCTVCEKTKEI